MASKIDIWNTSLSHIGHRAAIVSPDEKSAEAAHCRRFYPMALDITLERYAWAAATRREVLAQIVNPVDNQWMFAYAVPNECVKVRAVLPPECTDDTLEADFTIEADATGNPIILTNQEDAVAKFTTRITDTTKFAPMMVMSLSYDLASLLVGPIPKDMKLKQAMSQMAAYYTSVAEAADANASKTSKYRDFIPAHLAAR